ncbi:uncharacterized protein C17orf50 homolog [Ambystoma mexicanum]|uniref:uncharacterized protein C17orf50 homolog n=1 Tax=Ambystoma mexicanum TaxID=8296 RepID=UPI0037E8FB3D
MARVRIPEVPLEDELNEDDDSRFREYRGNVRFTAFSCCPGCCAFIRALCNRVRKKRSLPFQHSPKKWLISKNKHTKPEQKDKWVQKASAKAVHCSLLDSPPSGDICPDCQILSCKACQTLHVNPMYIQHCILDHYDEAGGPCVRVTPEPKPGVHPSQSSSFLFYFPSDFDIPAALTDLGTAALHAFNGTT